MGLTFVGSLNNRPNNNINLKSRNVVIYNISESCKEEAADKLNDDSQVVNEVLNHVLRKKVNILKIMRLGEIRDSNKPRPLLVTLANSREKWDVLKSGYLLKLSNQYKGLFITKDMTKEERERDRQLRVELNEMNHNDNNNYMIKNGQIIKRPQVNPTLGDYLNMRD